MSHEVFSSSFSRLPRNYVPQASRPAAKPSRSQKIIEYSLFAVFGTTIALAGVALYATNRPEHQRVPNHVAAGVDENRVNVLLIGTTNRRSAAGTDVIATQSLTMLSVQPSTGRAALVSIPPDLYMKVGRYGTRPLRAAHEVGDASGYPGAGPGLTVDTVQAALGQPIHAYARYDLGDLQKTVDALGGVDINVKNGVYEYRSKLRFTRGAHHLDGVRALRYAHSPYVPVGARDRFAREARQQEILLAILNEVEDREDLRALQSVFGASSTTNLTYDQLILLRDSLRRSDAVQTVSFKPYVDVIDVTSVAYRGEVVTPHGGDFAAVRQVAGAVFARMQ